MQHARYRSTSTDRPRHKECTEVEPLPSMLYILYTIYDQSQNFFQGGFLNFWVCKYFVEWVPHARRGEGPSPVCFVLIGQGDPVSPTNNNEIFTHPGDR